MLFSEPVFLLVFLPVLLGLYLVCPTRLRNLLLLIASLCFYAYGEAQYVVLLLVSIAFNFTIGRAMGASSLHRFRKGFLALGVAGHLALLASFKYANFLVDNLNALLALAGLPAVELGPVHLPIGISFFTFQAISYIVDIYRGAAEVQRNPVNLALYISLFPQLIAGPIVRYHDIANQLVRRVIHTSGFAYGIRRFVIGLAKKLVIANVVALPADRIFALPDASVTPGLAWFAVLCYAIQIFFDFSGYSDMAIGLGRMFGFKFLENFNYPYISRSVTEFWRRWHISLSTWYRDYLYIPLGGNRISPARTYAHLFIVFVLCGLWHGASWNFVIWGLCHGLFLILERAGLARAISAVPAAARHLYVLLIVLVTWVPFRAETLGQTGAFLSRMFSLEGGSGVRTVGEYMTIEVAVALVLGVIGSTRFVPWAIARWSARPRRAGPVRDSLGSFVHVAAFALLLLYCLMLMAAGTYNPFIYFRF